MKKTAREQCDKHLHEKLEQLANAVEARFAGAVEGARAFGRSQRPDLMERCDQEAEERMGQFYLDDQVPEFCAACTDFFRAEFELYRAHAEFLGLGQEVAA